MNAPRTWSPVAWIAVLALAAMGQYSFAQAPPDLGRGALCYALAALIFLGLVGAFERARPVISRALAPLSAVLGPVIARLEPILAAAGTASTAADRRARRRAVWVWLAEHPWRVGFVLASAALAVGLYQVIPSKVAGPSWADVIVIWVASMALYLVAFLPAPRPSAWSSAVLAARARATWAAHGGEIVLVLALTALGGVLRFWQLASIPDIVSGDEGRIGALGLTAVAGQMFPLGTSHGHGALYLLLIGLPLHWGGIDLVHLRLMSALPGMLTVPATYLIARAMFGPTVAAVAALVVAVNHMHLHFSRIMVAGGIMDAFFATVGLWLFYRAVTGRRVLDFVLSGLVMGLHVYIYMGGRLMILLTIVYVGLLWLVSRQRARAITLPYAAYVGMVLVTLVPMQRWMQLYPHEFGARFNQIGIFQSGWLTSTSASTGRSVPDLLWQQVLDSLLIFNYYPAKAFYGATLPMLDHLAGALFVLGVAYSLWHTREPRFLLLNGWVAAAAVGGNALLLEPSVSAYRVLVLFPAVAIMVALGAVKLVETVVRVDPRYARSGVAVLAAFALVVGVVNLRYYFVEFMPSCRFEDPGTRLASRLGMYLGTLDRSYTAYFYGGRLVYGTHPSVDFLSRNLPVQNVEPIGARAASQPPPAPVDPTRGATFVFLPERSAELAQVAERYPGGQRHELRDCDSTAFLVYEVPPRPSG